MLTSEHKATTSSTKTLLRTPPEYCCNGQDCRRGRGADEDDAWFLFPFGATTIDESPCRVADLNVPADSFGGYTHTTTYSAAAHPTHHSVFMWVGRVLGGWWCQVRPASLFYRINLYCACDLATSQNRSDPGPSQRMFLLELRR